MIKTTEDIVRAACRGDRTITPEQLRAGLDALAGKSLSDASKPLPLPVVLTREKVAELLNKTPKAVDVLCRRGALVRVYPTFPDGTRAARAAGITEESYRRYATGGAVTVEPMADAKAVAV